LQLTQHTTYSITLTPFFKNKKKVAFFTR